MSFGSNDTITGKHMAIGVGRQYPKLQADVIWFKRYHDESKYDNNPDISLVLKAEKHLCKINQYRC